jgi:hypothetical protein
VNIENLTVSGPVGGFSISTISTNVVYGILFNDSSGTVNNVTVEHIWQQPNASGAPSPNTGTAIRAEGSTAGRTLTITNTKVLDYQKNGIDGRGSMTLNVSASTIGPPHSLPGFIAPNGLVYVNGAGGTASGNTIFGAGDQAPNPGGSTAGSADGTGVLLFGATNVTITKNTITSDPSTPGTDIGISVTEGATGSAGITISFNHITRAGPDHPNDPTGTGIAVCSSHTTPLVVQVCGPLDNLSSATLICNTFSNWITGRNIVGALQISCTPIPDPPCGQPYSSSVLTVQGGVAPYTWSVVDPLPPGLSMAPSSGTISGTPTTAGTFHFTAHVTDSSAPPLSATQAASITVVGTCSEETGEPPGLPESSEPGEAAPVAPITTTGLAFTG